MIQARRESLGTGTANPRVLRRRGTDSFYSLAIMHVGGKQKKEFMTDEKKKNNTKKKKKKRYAAGELKRYDYSMSRTNGSILVHLS